MYLYDLIELHAFAFARGATFYKFKWEDILRFWCMFMRNIKMLSLSFSFFVEIADDGTSSSLARYEIWCMFMGFYYSMMKPLPICEGYEIIAHVDEKVSMHDEVWEGRSSKSYLLI